MKLIWHKIKKYKWRYASMILALTIVQILLFSGIGFYHGVEHELKPRPVFVLDNIYELRISFEESPTHSKTPIITTTYSGEKRKKIRAGFSENMQAVLEDIDGVDCASGEISELSKRIHSYRTYSDLDSSISVFVNPMGHNIQRMFPVELIKGNFFTANSDGNELILTETLARKLNLLQKNLPHSVTIPLKHSGKGETDEKNLTLVGVIKDLGYCMRDNANLEVFPLITENRFGSIYVRIEPQTELYALEQKIKEASLSITNDPEAVVQLAELSLKKSGEWNDMKGFAIPIAAIIPIFSLYVIMALFGMFWADLKRKTVDFGIMRAVGFTRRRMFINVLHEAVLLVGSSGVITLLLVCNINEPIKTMTKYISLEYTYTLSFLGLLVLVVLVALLPAVVTMRLKPIEALAEKG